ncbi:MAG TPA: HAD family hydrolase [Candidatus Limnocylindrales bacterium]|jgi:putative hydrolase of the HAD superfamily
MTGPLAERLRAITFDFGNTLVPVDRASLRRVVEVTAARLAHDLGPFDVDAFLSAWGEERDRQFREELPRFREVDLAQRLVRVLARLRGMTPPASDATWDDDLAAGRSTTEEIETAIEVYSDSFVDGIPPPPLVGPFLARFAERWPLAILSNWPLAATADRYVERAGWGPSLTAIVVSQRVGTIKPQAAIFHAAEDALGVDPPDRGRILHVGDDWAADVVGAKNAGWLAAYLRGRPDDSPLPSSVPDESVVPDLELAVLGELEGALFDAAPAGSDRGIAR